MTSVDIRVSNTYDHDTFSIALASVKSESYQQLIKICSQGKHCNNLYVYMHVYTYNRSVSSPRRLESFEVHSFRLELLASALSANCKSTETESKICK